MQIVLTIISVALLAVIIFFAVSPKSSRLLRISALVALGLICVSIAVCGFFLIRGPGESKAVVALPFILDDSPPPTKSNTPAIVLFIVVFLVILGILAYLSIREQKNKEVVDKKIAQTLHETMHHEESANEDEIDMEGESFDIGID